MQIPPPTHIQGVPVCECIFGASAWATQKVGWEPSVKCFNCDANAKTNEVIMSENKRKTVASKAEGRTEKTRERGERETEVIREPRNGSQVATK